MIQVSLQDIRTKIDSLLDAVENRGECVRIMRNGTPVADLRPVRRDWDPFKQDPQMAAVKFNENPTLPADEEDWPETCR